MVFDVVRAREEASKPGPAAQAPVMRSGAKSAAQADFERLVFSEQLLGADPGLKLAAGQPRPGVFNYFVGHNHMHWHTGAKSYALVTYRDAWRGVDMRLYGVNRDLKQEFVVKSGADPGRIRIALSGVNGLAIGRDGALLIHTALGDLRQNKPFAYQTAAGKRKAVSARFKVEGRDQFGFALASYDRRRPLVIDPALLYSTYLGGVHDDQGKAIAVDANGNAYIAGFTASEDFPVSANAYQLTRKNIGVYVYNAFVTKFSPSGTIIYSTFLGGSGDKGGCNGHGGDCGSGIAIDAQSDVYVAGTTGSSAVTPNAYQQTFGAGSTDAFVTELSPDGSALLYSTYLGSSGNVGAGSVAKGPGGIYVGGTAFTTSSFATTAGAFQRAPKGNENGFVAKIDPSRSGKASSIYSTLLGGSSGANYGGVYARWTRPATRS
jgi:hypothetical protein